MTPASKKLWKNYAIGLIWFFALLWPLLGIHADGTITFGNAAAVWIYVLAASLLVMLLVALRRVEALKGPIDRLSQVFKTTGSGVKAIPDWVWVMGLLVLALLFPFFTSRYGQDVAISVLVYICLGLGLNIVVGLAGMLDLGYIAFYGVGAYTYALLNIHFQVSYWLALPVAGATACLAGCIICCWFSQL